MENAIEHGLEPKAAGGSLEINADIALVKDARLWQRPVSIYIGLRRLPFLDPPRQLHWPLHREWHTLQAASVNAGG